MCAPTSDDLARSAARLLLEGRCATINEALDHAEHHLGSASRPAFSLVRRHWQGLLQQQSGEAGYAAYTRSVWVVAEEVLSSLATVCDDAPVYLVGRGARGQIDGPVLLTVRVYTTLAATDLARELVTLGYADPAFETLETRHGRLDGLRFEEEGMEILVIRCQPELLTDVDRNLFTEGRIERVDVDAVRARLRT